MTGKYESLKIDPSNLRALQKYGEVYSTMKRYEEAKADLNRASEIDKFALYSQAKVGMDSQRTDLHNYHYNTDWNMDDGEYWGCDVEACEYWDHDVDFLNFDEIKLDRTCKECNKSCRSITAAGGEWCQSCNSKHFQNDFPKWTSGNIDIDKCLQKTQFVADSPNKVIE